MTALRVAMMLMLACVVTSVRGQAYPAKPVRIVFPFAAGGPLDGLLRTVAEKMGARLGQPFLLESRPGAGGGIGAEAVARAPADGYTLLATIDTTFTVNPLVYRKLGYRIEDFRVLLTLSTNGSMLVVHPALGVKDLAGFMDRSRNENLAYSSAGVGSPGHLSGELLLHAIGARATHVPYKGNLPAVTDLVSGQVQFGVLGTAGLAAHLAAARLLALGVTARARSALAPSVPTFAELGRPELQLEFGQVLLAPRALPDPIAETLRGATSAALADPDVRARLAAGDYQPLAHGAAETLARIRSESERWSKVLRAAGVQPE